MFLNVVCYSLTFTTLWANSAYVKLMIFFYFPENRRQFAWNVKAYFLGKIKYVSRCCLLKFLPSMLNIKVTGQTSKYVFGPGWLSHAKRVFRSPESKAQDEFCDQLPPIIVPPSVCLSVIHPHLLNNFSSEIPGPISSNFMWNLLLKGVWKFVQMVKVH